MGRAARPTSLGCAGGKPRSLLSATHLCLWKGPPHAREASPAPWGDGGGAEAGRGQGLKGGAKGGRPGWEACSHRRRKSSLDEEGRTPSRTFPSLLQNRASHPRRLQRAPGPS